MPKNGVCSELSEVWKSICPKAHLLFALIRNYAYLCIIKQGSNNQSKNSIMKTAQNNISTSVNYPEMWGASTVSIQAEYSVGKYKVTAPNEISLSRGITFNGTVDEFGANNRKNARAGYFRYYMTEAAFRAFCKRNSVEINVLLD